VSSSPRKPLLPAEAAERHPSSDGWEGRPPFRWTAIPPPPNLGFPGPSVRRPPRGRACRRPLLRDRPPCPAATEANEERRRWTPDLLAWNYAPVIPRASLRRPGDVALEAPLKPAERERRRSPSRPRQPPATGPRRLEGHGEPGGTAARSRPCPARCSMSRCSVCREASANGVWRDRLCAFYLPAGNDAARLPCS
jgi:hypothetical protein